MRYFDVTETENEKPESPYLVRVSTILEKILIYRLSLARLNFS